MGGLLIAVTSSSSGSSMTTSYDRYATAANKSNGGPPRHAGGKVVEEERGQEHGQRDGRAPRAARGACGSRAKRTGAQVHNGHGVVIQTAGG
jgi:hypothetical protein